MARYFATFLVTCALSGAASGVAHADQCQDDVVKIDATLSGSDLDADMRAQLEDMRSQAVQLCGAGNTEEGTAVTAEALALIEGK